MPEISRFYGIAISIRFIGREHNPPHFHAKYKGKMAAYTIRTLEKIEGKLPPTAENLVKEWAKLHQEELLDIWEKQNFVKVEPLE